MTSLLGPLSVSSTYAAPTAVLAAVPLLILWQMIKVDLAREALRIPYPYTFAADDAEWTKRDPAGAARFNCMQRAHSHTLETLPVVLPSAVILASSYSLPAAALGATWIVGRIAFTRSYAAGDPKKRSSSIFARAGEGAAVLLVLGSVFVAGQGIRRAYF